MALVAVVATETHFDWENARGGIKTAIAMGQPPRAAPEVKINFPRWTVCAVSNTRD